MVDAWISVTPTMVGQWWFHSVGVSCVLTMDQHRHKCEESLLLTVDSDNQTPTDGGLKYILMTSWQIWQQSRCLTQSLLRPHMTSSQSFSRAWQRQPLQFWLLWRTAVTGPRSSGHLRNLWWNNRTTHALQPEYRQHVHTTCSQQSESTINGK